VKNQRNTVDPPRAGCIDREGLRAFHRKPCLPARAGFEETAGGRDIRDAKDAGRRPRGVRGIHRADQASAALILRLGPMPVKPSSRMYRRAPMFPDDTLVQSAMPRGAAGSQLLAVV
jgi:hypothetical protein